jgi:glucose/arabinose dehydrogenase/chitodextrinase
LVLPVLLVSILALYFRSAAPAESAVAGLVAAYSFDEASGSSAGDSSGAGNPGSIGSATWTASGRYGSALQFNGAGARVTVADSTSLDLTAAMTLEAWVYPTAAGGWDDVIYKGPNDIYYLEGSSPGGPPGVGGTFSPSPVIGSSALALNTWSHLAGTYDGSTLRLFVNGTEVASKPQTGPIATSTGELTIGGDALYGQYFTGRIDEVRVYSVALSQAQIQTDMATPIGNQQPDPNPPTVSITSPAPNAQVSDIVNITANASDDVGVAGVQFLVDGTTIGVEDPTAPYGVAWDTRSVSNGAHTLTARARDAGGNVTTSAPVIVNVSNANYFQNEVLATGFTLPTNIEFLPDGRMLVVELAGTIKVLPPPYTQPDPAPFLQLTNVGSAGVQQGIYDIALDPAFTTNRFYYVFYTLGSPNRDRLSRFTANASLTGTVAGSELVLYQDPQDASSEHHGGAIAFGNDGKLYFTTGEHFNAGDSQLLNNPRGKIHRINKDGTIPTDNPFYDGSGPNVDSIWARGLRNPFRAYYDAPTGRLFVGDVGGNDYSTAKEEVNVGVAGANYGWPNCEGNCGAPYTDPIYAYPHNGRDASITGGFVYHGTQYPSSYRGAYFFADYTQNWIKYLTLDAGGSVTGVFNFEPANGAPDGPYGDIVYLTEGPDGALYYVDLGYSDIGGSFGVSKIRRIRYVQSNQPPIAVVSADKTAGPVPLTVNFSSVGSSDPEGQPLTYSWTFGDGGTSTAANPSHTYTQAGQYTARLSLSDGTNTTLSTPIIIGAGSPPTATILAPQDGITFRAGDVISFSGDATDPDDGSLPASAYTWNIDFLHEGHVHPGIPITGVKSGTFTIPTTGHDFSGNTRWRVALTVTDSTGLTSTTSVIIWPQKVNLTFSTIPAGLTLYLDGIAKVTPFVHDTLIGFNHTIEARNQTFGATNYTFASWSDGGAQTHTIVVPSANANYVATFQAAAGPAPVAAYGFDEGTGTTFGDASGSGNNGTLTSTTWTTSGKFGNAVVFNGSGSGSRGTVPDSASLDLTTGMTLEAWVYPTAGGGWRDVVYKGPNDIYYLEGSSTTGPPGLGGTFSPGTLLAPSALPLNTWSHLAGTYDGSTLRLYVNGTQVASKPQTGAIATSTGALTLGSDALYGQYFQGRIDEVRIYNVALTQAQIQADMAAPITPTGPDGQPPTAPSGLGASAVSASQINLSWTASSDNVGVTGYRVERCQGASCTNFVEVAQPSGTTYSDVGLLASTAYRYQVRAVDAAGNLSAYSGIATATTLGTSNLVAAYSFNEGTGTAVADASGTGNNGTISGATWTTAGRYGNALVFNGTSARVTVPDSPSLRLTTGMTLEAWVYAQTVNGGWRDVVYKGNDNYYLEATSRPVGRPAGGAVVNGQHAEVFGTANVAANTWTHLAVTYNGSTVRLYVNGTLASSLDRAGSILTSSNPLSIGSDAIYGQYFNGRIDEVRVYNVARTQAQIQADMNGAIS